MKSDAVCLFLSALMIMCFFMPVILKKLSLKKRLARAKDKIGHDFMVGLQIDNHSFNRIIEIELLNLGITVCPLESVAANRLIKNTNYYSERIEMGQLLDLVVVGEFHFTTGGLELFFFLPGGNKFGEYRSSSSKIHRLDGLAQEAAKHIAKRLVKAVNAEKKDRYDLNALNEPYNFHLPKNP